MYKVRLVRGTNLKSLKEFHEKFYVNISCENHQKKVSLEKRSLELLTITDRNPYQDYDWIGSRA